MRRAIGTLASSDATPRDARISKAHSSRYVSRQFRCYLSNSDLEERAVETSSSRMKGISRREVRSRGRYGHSSGPTHKARPRLPNGWRGMYVYIGHTRFTCALVHDRRALHGLIASSACDSHAPDSAHLCMYRSRGKESSRTRKRAPRKCASERAWEVIALQWYLESDLRIKLSGTG